MRTLRRLVWLLAASVAVVLGIWLVQDNSADTPVVLLGFRIGELPLGIWLGLAFLSGVLVTTVATLPLVAGNHLRERRMQRQLDRQQPGQ